MDRGKGGGGWVEGDTREGNGNMCDSVNNKNKEEKRLESGVSFPFHRLSHLLPLGGATYNVFF